jgi:hypothetical protein
MKPLSLLLYFVYILIFSAFVGSVIGLDQESSVQQITQPPASLTANYSTMLAQVDTRRFP